MTKNVTISEARAKLFELVDYVTETPDGVVLIRHRDRKERAALVSESQLEYLRISARAQATRRRAAFRLIGSATLHVDPEEVLQSTRTRQGARFERARARSCCGDERGRRGHVMAA